MAVFAPSYKIIRVGEGYYGWIPGDAGEETYAGVARAFNKTWAGWPTLDAYKEKMKKERGFTGVETASRHVLKPNEVVPGMETFVTQFYQDWYNRLGMTKVKSQELADIVFDFIVNSASTGILETEQVLQNVMKAPGFKADRTWDQQSIDLINSFEPAKLFKAILAERDAFYDRLANAYKSYVVLAGETAASIAAKFKLPASVVPAAIKVGQTLSLQTQMQFKKGWHARLDKFRSITPAAVVGGSLGAVALGVLIFFLVKTKTKKK